MTPHEVIRVGFWTNIYLAIIAATALIVSVVFEQMWLAVFNALILIFTIALAATARKIMKGEW
jgi:hypothetical protein